MNVIHNYVFWNIYFLKRSTESSSYTNGSIRSVRTVHTTRLHVLYGPILHAVFTWFSIPNFFLEFCFWFSAIFGHQKALVQYEES